MKTLSKNFYGAVKTTANQGFSVKRTVKKVRQELLDNNYVIIEENVASTGSTYLLIRKSTDKEWDTTEIRISNHTKRGEKLKWTCALSYNVFDELDEINILNSEMLHEVLDFIRS